MIYQQPQETFRNTLQIQLNYYYYNNEGLFNDRYTSSLNNDPYEYWNEKIKYFKEISMIGKVMTSLNINEAVCEQLFSQLGWILNIK